MYKINVKIIYRCEYFWWVSVYEREFLDQEMTIQACLKVARYLRIFSFLENLSIPRRWMFCLIYYRSKKLSKRLKFFAFMTQILQTRASLFFILMKPLSTLIWRGKGSYRILQTHMVVLKLLLIFHSFNSSNANLIIFSRIISSVDFMFFLRC